jgi:nitroreductase
MSDLLSLIQTRRSCRKYELSPIPEEMLAQVLKAIRWAPSWANTQCWEIIVVKDKAIKEALQASLPSKGNPAFKAIVEAPVVLVMCARTGRSGFYKDQAMTKFGDWMLYDLGLATQNACLTAHSLGLATVVVGHFDHAEAARAVDLPKGYELVSMVPMGFPVKTGQPPKRREVTEFTHNDRW